MWKEVGLVMTTRDRLFKKKLLRKQLIQAKGVPHVSIRQGMERALRRFKSFLLSLINKGFTNNVFYKH